jgi:hypothetical protein
MNERILAELEPLTAEAPRIVAAMQPRLEGVKASAKALGL